MTFDIFLPTYARFLISIKMKKNLSWLHSLSIAAVFSFTSPVITSAQDTAKQDLPIILAHRGGMGEFEENTMAAFQACVENGIKGYEIDIRMTEDGHLVVLHDDSFNRTHEGEGPVESRKADEVRDIKTRKGKEPLLFLSDFLDYFSDKPGMYIELEMKTSKKDVYTDAKVEEYAKKLYELAESKRPEGSTYVYSSFDERPLRVIHKLNPKTPLSFIAGKPCSPEFIAKALDIGADRIACNIDGSSRASIREAHKAGLKVNGWPGRAPADYQLAIALGLDVHCTDFPIAVQESVKTE